MSLMEFQIHIPYLLTLISRARLQPPIFVEPNSM
jgi:hypothetical protein